MRQHKTYDRLYITKIKGETVRLVKSRNGKRIRIRSDTTIGGPSFLKDYKRAFADNINTDASVSAFEDMLQKRLSRARHRAFRKGVKFDLGMHDIREMWEVQSGTCAVSGLEMSSDDIATQPSIDRIIPKKGYVKSNVRLVCYAVNAGINTFGTERYIEICMAVAENNLRSKVTTSAPL